MFINSLFSFHVTILFLTFGSGKTFPLSGIQSLPIPAPGCKYIYLHLQGDLVILGIWESALFCEKTHCLSEASYEVFAECF